MVQQFPLELPLFSEELYRYGLQFVAACNPSSHEHDALVECARQGDSEAQEQIILLSLRYVAKVANTFYRTMDHGLDELGDLIAIGNLALVEGLSLSLKSTNPFAYLRVVARHAMWRHCKNRSHLITLPTHCGLEGQGPVVKSLDAPVGEGKTCYGDIVEAYLATLPEVSHENPLVEYLQEAVNTVLSPYEREVVQLKYGLIDGQEPLTGSQIDQQLGRSPLSSAKTFARAAKKMRRYLEEHAS